MLAPSRKLAGLALVPSLALLGAALTSVSAGATAQSTILPEWLERDEAVLRGTREGVVPDRDALFASAPATTDGPLSSALLLCRVHVTEPAGSSRASSLAALIPGGRTPRRWDTLADPDLLVTLRVGRFRGAAWGPENAREAIVSFAGVSLPSSAALTLRVFDRDVTGDEHIDTLRMRFGGETPFSSSARHTRGECRVAAPALVAERAEGAAREAGRHLEVAASASPDVTRADLGRSPAQIASRAAIARVRAYRGLADPGSRALLVRADSLEAEFDRRLRIIAASALGTAPRRGAWVPLPDADPRARVVELGCGRVTVARLAPGADRDDRCVVVVELEAPSEGLSADVIDARGALSPARVQPLGGEGHRLALLLPVRVDARRHLVRLGRDRRALLALR